MRQTEFGLFVVEISDFIESASIFVYPKEKNAAGAFFLFGASDGNLRSLSRLTALLRTLAPFRSLPCG